MRLLVAGATGAQGGSVARAALDRGWPVRALVRSPSTAAARALAAAGAELVVGDLGDAARVARVAAACDAIFGVTNYWEHGEAEVAHGRALVDAARATDAAIVLSTLPSAHALSGGAIAVPHLETKAAIAAYARDAGARASFVHVAFYYENFLSWFAPRRGPDGVLGFGFPQGEAPLAAVAVADLGPLVLSLFAEPPGATIGAVGDEQPCSAYAAMLGDALGERVTYTHVPRDAFAALPVPGAADLAAMFDLNRRFVGSRAAELADARRRHPGLRTFATWAAQHLHRRAG